MRSDTMNLAKDILIAALGSKSIAIPAFTEAPITGRYLGEVFLTLAATIERGGSLSSAPASPAPAAPGRG